MNKCLIVYLLICSTTVLIGRNVDYIPLDQIMNKVSVDITSNGGYLGKCIHFKIQNKTSDTLNVRIEAGYNLDSENDHKQDILVVRTQELKIHKSLEFDVEGYCNQSSKGSPSKGERYRFVGYHKDSFLVLLAKFINKTHYKHNDIQHAIWSIADHHNLASISKDSNNLALRKYIAAIKGEEIPWYEIKYARSRDTTRVFSDFHEAIEGTIEFDVKYPSYISILVKNEQGAIMKYLKKNTSKNVGHYTYDIDFQINFWPKGNYILYIVEDESNINKFYNIKI